MNQSFYTAAVGARQQQQRLNVQSNNIANVNTFGFKAERPSFQSLICSGLEGIDGAQLPRGVGGRLAMADPDFSQGAIATTGRRQDYAIHGQGYFGLYDPDTEEISYTRDGSFTLVPTLLPNAQGEPEETLLLSDGDGRFVLSDAGELIKVQDREAAQAVGVFDFLNTNGLRPVGDNRYLPVDKNGQVRIGTGKAVQGELEGSNTDLAYELAKVIESQRTYSMALKMVQTSDEVESTINSLRS